MKFPNIPLLVLDTETTGFVPGLHRVIEYACMEIRGGEIVSEFDTLISPEEDEIPPHVQVMTQIRPEDMKGQPAFGEVFETLEKMLKKDLIIVGQNIKYDVSMLKGEGWDLNDYPMIDTAMLASLVFPEIKSYSLGYLSAVLGLSHAPKHRALGDVRATSELLSKCFERLLMLPGKDIETLAGLAGRGPEGYRRFFRSLADASEGSRPRPEWLSLVRRHFLAGKSDRTVTIGQPPPAKVQVTQESLDPAFLPAVIKGAGKNTWVAAKNVDSLIRRLPEDCAFNALPSPDFILSKAASETFLSQDRFTDDEVILAMKLKLFSPKTRADLPLHGEENHIWSAKLAANSESPEYFLVLEAAKTGPVLLSHFELLHLAERPAALPPEGAHLIIDDASMLEDTATQALGWLCLLPTLRAGAEGNPLLTKCADLVELWIEKTRGGLDRRYLAENDLETKEAAGLRSILGEVMDRELKHPARRALDDLMKIMDIKNLGGRICWIEAFIDGSKSIRSVPENVAGLLAEKIYSRFRTTLIVPKSSQENTGLIIPPGQETAVAPPVDFGSPEAEVVFSSQLKINDFIAEPKGKTVFLASSKRTIEDIYIKHAEQAETAGVTLLCQGFSGGQSRMQAEFSVAPAPAIIFITPWIYETFELPSGTLDRLVIQALPFDHPSHAVFNRRSQKFQDPFMEYSVPRLRHRLFRLIRTFCRHAKQGGTVEILDERITTKAYGKELKAYLTSLLPEKRTEAETGKQIPIS